MLRRLRGKRPSPALVLGVIALVAATSGAAIALPGVNSVDSGDIKNGQVKRPDVRNNAVNTAKVANGSLLAADFAPGQIPGGPAGPAGATGATGATGPPGPGAAGFHAAVTAAGAVAAAQSSAGTTVVHTAGATNPYLVRFSANVRNCAYVADVGLPGASGASGPGEVTTVGDATSVNGVFIQTFTSAGALAERPFYLAVLC